MELDLSYWQKWIVIVSGCLSILSVAAGILLKFMAESRLLDAQKVESDIKLLKLFTDLMDVAHSRVSTGSSEKLLQVALEKQELVQAVIDNRLTIAHLSALSRPVGIASQDAAIAAVAELGRRHETLYAAAVQALRTLSTFKGDVATPYLDKLIQNR
jgi:hypothetical protein